MAQVGGNNSLRVLVKRSCYHPPAYIVSSCLNVCSAICCVQSHLGLAPDHQNDHHDVSSSSYDVTDQSSGKCPMTSFRVAICPLSDDVLLIDYSSSLVQLFSNTGRLQSTVAVPGVTGGCFLTECRLALSTRSGVDLYCKAGFILIYEDRGLSIGPVLNTVPYNNAFIAVQSHRFLFTDLRHAPTQSYTFRHGKCATRLAPDCDMLYVEIVAYCIQE